MHSIHRVLAVLTATLAAMPCAVADNWDNSSGNSQWSTATNWADNTEPGINDPVVFPSPIPSGLATISLVSGEFASTLAFNDNYTLSAGNLNLGADSINVVGGKTATINTALVGSGGLTKTGGGTLNLLPTSSNSFTGTVNINDFNSAILIRSNTALGSSSNAVNLNAGRLRLDGSSSPTFLMVRVITPGALGGTIELMNNAFLDLNAALGANSNPLTLAGQGTAEFNSTSTRTGSTFVDGVVVRLNSANGLGTPGSAILSNSAKLELANGITYAGFLTLNNTTSLRGGGGLVTFNGFASVGGSGTVFLSGGNLVSDTLLLGGAASDVYRQGTGSTLTVVRDSGTVQANVANSYAGNWRIDAGKLRVGHIDALGTGVSPIAINFGGTMQLDTGTYARPITVNAGGTLALNTDVTTSGDITLSLGGGTLSGATHQLALDGATLTATGSGVTTEDGILGLSPSSTGAATLINSNWTMSDSFAVGYAGAGTLSAQAGGDVSSAIAHIGSLPGSTGDATVTGAGSIWTNSGFLGIGYSGEGTLNIEDGGSVSTNSSFIATEPGSEGAVNVTGNGSTWNVTGAPVVGEHGLGELTISAGGSVTGTGAFIGRFDDGSGAVTVTGTSSTWTNNGDLLVGSSGSGTLTIEAGGDVSNTGYCQIGASTGSDGAVTVTGAGSTLTSDELYVGFTGVGALNIQDGGSVSATDASIAGAPAPASSSANVSGAGTTWTNSGELDVGDGGTATLTIEAGAAVSALLATVGRFIGGNGAATVTGPGSTWTNDNLAVGYQSGTGTLDVQNGGHISSANGSVGNSSGTGTATISGAGSVWDISGALSIAFLGAGTLLVENSGSVSSLSAHLGFGSGANATATVTGANSAWTIGALGIEMSANGATSTLNLTGGTVTVGGNITDGGSGVSTLTLDGGTLNMQNHNIGGTTPIDNLNFRSGTLRNVTQINNGAGLTKVGPGTLVLNTANTYTGLTSVGEGVLRVSNSTASATGTGFVSVSNGATLAGTGRIGGPLQNNGSAAPGASAGTLTIQNTYTQGANGSLDVEIGGTAAGTQYDRLAVTGTATLAGTLNVSLINGFIPALGNTFDVLTAGTRSGTFATVNVPTLPGSMSWEIQHLPTSVRLSVVEGAVPGDVDGDGHVTLNDLTILLSGFGFCVGDPGFISATDFDGDGCTNLADLTVLLANFGL